MIKQVFLRNFKCFETEPVPFGALTLLAGLNGMGKSSILQALLLLRQSFQDGLLPDIGLELNGPLVQLGTAQDLLYEDASIDQLEVAVKWANATSASFVFDYQREADVLRINRPIGEINLSNQTPFSDNFHYLRAERLGPRTTNVLSDYEVRQHRQLGAAGEYSEHFLQSYGADPVTVSMRHPGSFPDGLQNQVQAWLNEISPGTELHLAIHPEMDVVNLRYSFVTGEQRSNTYRSTSVGFGLTYVLPVLVAVLSSKPGTLILLENPEAHLHPRGQVRMGELLAKAAAAGIQIVVETHSDHVLNGIRLAVHSKAIDPGLIAINYFSRIEKGGRVKALVESPTIDNNGRLDRWPDGFFDEWEKSLEQLLGPQSEIR